ncbi:hypothetical protein C8J57DRAFT_1226311 [Mycena rebaudengoi]|nr:hypothetical protein C8J57DRAFT_1226311 [Mycena rebaudengoi]
MQPKNRKNLCQTIFTFYTPGSVELFEDFVHIFGKICGASDLTRTTVAQGGADVGAGKRSEVAIDLFGTFSIAQHESRQLLYGGYRYYIFFRKLKENNKKEGWTLFTADSVKYGLSSSISLQGIAIMSPEMSHRSICEFPPVFYSSDGGGESVHFGAPR